MPGPRMSGMGNSHLLLRQALLLTGMLLQASQPFAALGADSVAKAATEESASAPDTGWWSLRPIGRPAVPAGEGNPVDVFIHDRLKAEGWEPSPAAGREVLVRRLYFDLLGLPPTLEQVREFCEDASPDAWERLVDRLLASPHYGEHWARHWLDVIHFADTHGFEHDVFRPHAWRFRDYVIAALNRDTPWGRFIEEQLAADVLFPDQPELMPALGFLGAGPYDASAAGTAPMSFENLDRDDLVTQTMSAFTSTTANCARCHAHKFDAIPQEDYYALQAVFAGVGKGDISYDETTATAQARRRAMELRTAARTGNAGVLTQPEHAARLAKWEKERRAVDGWRVLQAETFVSAGGATLTRQPDGSVLAAGARPDKETLTVTAGTDLKRITAFRLEVMPDPSLPAGGPGRADNGNLHLTSIGVQVFAPGANQGTAISIPSASSDWDEPGGWSVDKILDADPATEWGIYPKVGQAHQAVFTFAAPVEVPSGAKLTVTLNQWHGGAHIIGRFRLSVTSAPPALMLALNPTADAALAKQPAERTPEETLSLSSTVLGILAAQDLAALPPPVQVYAAGTTYNSGGGPVTLNQPRVIRVLQRGDLSKPGAEVPPGALSEISALPARFPVEGGEGQRRVALARWLADGRNPLTWRSIANRVWQFHFGAGLSSTPGDFGKMGSQPSHPVLLDWLAAELRDNGGSLKKLHRIILTSHTWRQSAGHRPEQAKRDPDNHLLWRMNSRRLQAEGYCDAVLQASGKLDLAAGGPGVPHFISSPGPQSTPVLDYAAYDWNSPGSGRRSIYRVVWRGISDPLFDALDFPDAAVLTPARGFSAAPLQALVLWNNNFILHHAAALAERAGREAAADPLTRMYQLVLLRDPRADELETMRACAAQDGLAEVARILFNTNEFLFVQ
ncbi:MAG: DUF1553 domain-containing protein [Verrucomicrobiaceae bacterium]|nr:MAG: DUF1553 domain-containing protein [Verrucomicrobiaceae bacterium]